MDLPGGPMATRPLHFFFLADTSGSMMGEKIASLNHAIQEAIPHMRDVAKGNPNASVEVRAITFASNARWLVPDATPVERFDWPTAQAGGATAMGEAIRLLADALSEQRMPRRALPPVVVLVTDGEPTDDFNSALAALKATPWGNKSVRIGIAIGADANLDVLQRFIDNPEIAPLTASNPEQLVKFIRWASTAVLQAASAPPSQAMGGASHGNVPVPAPPAAPSGVGTTDVW